MGKVASKVNTDAEEKGQNPGAVQIQMPGLEVWDAKGTSWVELHMQPRSLSEGSGAWGL